MVKDYWKTIHELTICVFDILIQVLNIFFFRKRPFWPWVEGTVWRHQGQ